MVLDKGMLLKFQKLNYLCIVKSSVRILGVTVLAALYCFAVHIVTYSQLSSGHGNHQTTEQEQYLATVSSSLFHHTSEAERSVSNLTNFPVPNFKNLIDKLWLITQSTGRLLEAKFAQYCHFSVNFLIHFRKSDLIFPFHYFW